ncbi:hypothetical protein [Paraliomyxa miuraensis]|uniref:hypothetical protein n=1 Tax=Paraliomyxa miuraensis TaxID=376150 RepID=UPI00225944AA|nr:hypothetical protein [Paraliomyxa miuraensis]MCX4243599.1 hypothetical protein [Paraliomyxa miuraensis]
MMIGAAAVLLSCQRAPAPASSADGTSTGEADGTTSTGQVVDDTAGPSTGDLPPDEPDDERFWITHAFGPLAMPAWDDDASRCVSWTVGNARPVYAQAVLASNEGGFHHSNWFVVPEDVYPGPDGYWPCDERGFNELDAATKGTVLFAQSTQSYVEEQRLAPGAVLKLPERAKIVAGLHTLNASPRAQESGLWISLEPLHPADVTAVVSPVSMQYHDLHLPPMTESRVTADCNLATPYAITSAGDPLWLRVHYILPHYHYLGNHFDVTVVGGELDGQSIFSIEGFDADASGMTFDPPLDLPGATGLRMTCGYDNWTSNAVEWGNGDGEMCVMLALVETDYVIGASVDLGNHLVDVVDGIHMYEGVCIGLALPKAPEQGMPTEPEILAPLYLPPIDPADQGLPPIPPCHDADPSAEPDAPATLGSLRETIFAPGCSFSSCPGPLGAAGLDLTAADLHAELLGHALVTPAGMPLVDPGNPDNSWLYHLLADCEPTVASGVVVSHMPKNAPKLLDDELVAQLRVWIEAGALDD